MGETPTPDTEQPGTATPFSALLNYLFRSRLSPEGKEYSLADVSRATGLKVPYLSSLRAGKIAMPPADRVHLLADFFGVNAGYFTGRHDDTGLSGVVEDTALRAALSKPLVREVALRAGSMGPAERALVLEMLNRADEMARAAAAAEAADHGQTPAATDTPDATDAELNPAKP